MKTGFRLPNRFAASLAAGLAVFPGATLVAGESSKEIHIYRGKTPALDGVIAPGEYDDATRFESFGDWAGAFNQTTAKEDLSLTGCLKHDGMSLYAAFDVTDDVIYGTDTDRWLPEENPDCHRFSQLGWSWFGDGVEIFLNPSCVWPEFDSRGEGDRWRDGQFNDGSGRSWQMICSAGKSWKGRLERGGLMPGEQRVNLRSFRTFTRWIEEGAMEAVVKIKPGGKGYVVEWRIGMDPCVEVKPGVFWEPALGTARMGFNMAVQDLDEKEKGEGNFGHFNHEDWWTGVEKTPFLLKNFGTLFLHPGLRPHEITVGPDEPVKTLPEARARVRELVKKGLDRDVLVRLKGGSYVLEKPLAFDSGDSGTEEHAVTYTAFPGYVWPGEKVEISGGRALAGWKPAGPGLWRVAVPESLQPRQIFKDGRRLSRSRFPNDGHLTVKEVSDDFTTITFEAALPDFDPAGALAELVTIQNWALCRGIVQAASPDRATTGTAMAWVGHSALRAKPGNPAYLENHPAFIDADDEWCFEPATGTIFYQAPEGEDPNTKTFIVPAMEHLITIEGTPETPARNLHFQGLTFTHAAWALPEIGYRGIQAGYHGTSEKPAAPVFCQPAAIECRYAEDCSFELCRVAHTGASGIGIGEGCRRNRVTGCRLEDIGCNGIHIGHRTGALLGPSNVLDKDWDTDRQIPVDNRAASNFVRTCGQISSGAVGIFDAFTRDTVIAHNVITELPYSGISVGYRWSRLPSSQRHCRVEYNRIFNVLNDVVDGGGIYTLGVQPETLIRGNLIYEVHRSDFGHGAPNNGFFFDECSSGFTIEENIVFATSGKPVRHNRNTPEDHTWKNNYFGVGPSGLNFPWHKAGLAGFEPAYREKVIRD